MSDKKPTGDRASQLCESIIGAPNLVSEVIRSLIVDYGKGNFKYSANSKFLALRLIRAPSVHVPLFFATLTFMKDQFDGVDSLQPEEVIQLYRPLDMTVLLTNLYLFRRARSITPPDEWEYIQTAYLEQMELGGYFGYAIPDVGPAYGLLVGGLRPLTFAVFAQHYEKEFKTYRRNLKTRGVLYDIKQEVSLFGCSHVDIVRTFMQKLGFGAGMARAIFDALSDAPIEEDDITGDFARFSASGTWIESLSLKADIPHSDEEEEDLDEKAINKLLTQVKQFKEKGSEFSWPTKKPEEYPQPDLLYKVKEKKKKVTRTKIVETSESMASPPRTSTEPTPQPEAKKSEPQKVSEVPSQNEIDDIFASIGSEPSGTASQDDIDALFSTPVASSPPPQVSEKTNETATQDDIDALFAGPPTAPETAPVISEETKGTASQDDIDALFSSPPLQSINQEPIEATHNKPSEPVIEQQSNHVEIKSQQNTSSSEVSVKIETVQKAPPPPKSVMTDDDDEEIPEEILREFGLIK